MANQYLPRVGKVDFFAALPPGFYIVFCIAFSGVAVSGGQSPTEIGSLLTPSEESSGPPIYVVSFVTILVLFASYIFGCIVRLIPVNNVDRWCSYLRSRENGENKKDWKELVHADRFPYSKALRYSYDQLKRHRHIEFPTVKFLDEGKPVSMAVFDYWKMVLCQSAPNLFAYTQSLEARVRFLAGMVWAGVLGAVSAASALCFPIRTWSVWTILGLVLFVLACIPPLLVMFEPLGMRHVLKRLQGKRDEPRRLWPFVGGWVVLTLLCGFCGTDGAANSNPWSGLAWGLLWVSSAMVLLLTWRLRNARAEEANQVFLGYLACVPATREERRADSTGKAT